MIVTNGIIFFQSANAENFKLPVRVNIIGSKRLTYTKMKKQMSTNSTNTPYNDFCKEDNDAWAKYRKWEREHGLQETIEYKEPY